MKPEIYKGSKWLFRNAEELLEESDFINLKKIVDELWLNVPETAKIIREFVKNHPVRNDGEYEIYIYDHGRSFSVRIETNDERVEYAVEELGSTDDWVEELNWELSDFGWGVLRQFQEFWIATIWYESKVILNKKNAHTNSYTESFWLNLKNYYCQNVEPTPVQITDISPLLLFNRINENPPSSPFSSFLFKNNKNEFIEIIHNGSYIMKRIFRGFEEVSRERLRCLPENYYLPKEVFNRVQDILNQDFDWIDYPKDFPPLPEVIFTRKELYG